MRGAHVNVRQLLSLSSVFTECGLVMSWWTLQLHLPLHGGEDVGTQFVLLSGTHVESGESRSLHDEDLVADGIR